MPRLATVCLIVSMLMGCASSGPSIDNLDEFSGLRFQMSNSGFLKNNKSFGAVRLDAAKATDHDGKIEIALVVQYKGSDWMFIAAGETLKFIVDGEHISAFGLGSHDRDVGGGMVYEKAIYGATPDLIRRLANATNVRVQVSGKDGVWEGEFKEETFVSFRDFVAEVLEPSAL